MSTDREKQAGANTAGQSALIEPLEAEFEHFMHSQQCADCLMKGQEDQCIDCMVNAKAIWDAGNINAASKIFEIVGEWYIPSDSLIGYRKKLAARFGL